MARKAGANDAMVNAMKAIYIEHHGAIEDLKVSEVPVPSIGSGDVLVKVEASGINPSDVGSVLGKFPTAVLPRIVGRDFAGKVVDGPVDVIGAEVWGSGGDLGISRDGTHAEYVAIPRQAATRRPKNLSMEEASAVGVPFITAFSALVSVGQLKEGEWVIISGAAGSVGQAATQIAHAKGGRVVREATNGRGADLALNGVGSSVFGALLEALAVEGRQVVYSAAGGREFPLDLSTLYRNQFAIFGLDTQKFDATRCAGILSNLAPLFESGALTPPKIAGIYNLSQVREAYGRVAAGGGGKVVFVLG